MIMRCHGCITISLFKAQDQKLLTLWWHSVLGDGSNILNTIFANKGGQHIHYSLMLLQMSLIIQDGRIQIVDTPLTLIPSSQ